MSRDAAAALVRGALLALGLDSAGLNAHGFGGVRLGSRTLSFEYEEAGKALAVRAHLYQFKQSASPQLLARLGAAAAAAPLAGAQLAYVADARLLCLELRVAQVTGGAELAAQLRALAVAGVAFAQEHL